MTTRRSSRISTPKIKMTTKKNLTTRKPRIIFENDSIKKRCTRNHSEYATWYKEESDRRYFKTGMELHDTRCFDCKALFSHDTVEGEGCCMPSTVQPVIFCEGRIKVGCKHGMCHGCHLIHTKSGDRGSRRKRNNT